MQAVANFIVLSDRCKTVYRDFVANIICENSMLEPACFIGALVAHFIIRTHFNNGGKQRLKEAGYNACYFGGAARTSGPYGEDDAEMRQAWIEGWQEADADCWAFSNAA